MFFHNRNFLSEAGWKQNCPITELSANMLHSDWSFVVARFPSRKLQREQVFRNIKQFPAFIIRCNRVGHLFIILLLDNTLNILSCINCLLHLTILRAFLLLREQVCCFVCALTQLLVCSRLLSELVLWFVCDFCMCLPVLGHIFVVVRSLWCLPAVLVCCVLWLSPLRWGKFCCAAVRREFTPLTSN